LDPDDSDPDDSDSKCLKSKMAKVPIKIKKSVLNIESDDEKYRKLVQNLIKSTKQFNIRGFNIHPDPTTLQECFRIWIADLRNILSTEH
jgi:hypothetical protein